MFSDTIMKLADAGAEKARMFREQPSGFLIGAMAGIYVGFGILLAFSLGSPSSSLRSRGSRAFVRGTSAPVLSPAE